MYTLLLIEIGLFHIIYQRIFFKLGIVHFPSQKNDLNFSENDFANEYQISRTTFAKIMLNSANS